MDCWVMRIEGFLKVLDIHYQEVFSRATLLPFRHTDRLVLEWAVFPRSTRASSKPCHFPFLSTLEPSDLPAYGLFLVPFVFIKSQITHLLFLLPQMHFIRVQIQFSNNLAIQFREKSLKFPRNQFPHLQRERILS